MTTSPTLKVIPKTLSYTFSVMDGANSVAEAVDMSWWRDKGELRVQDATYTARREKSTYLLESANGLLAQARHPRWLSRELILDYAGRSYALRPKSLREFRLFDGETQIGSVTPEGVFTRKAAVDLPPTLPLFLQIFIIWLVMTQWKHADQSAVYAG